MTLSRIVNPENGAFAEISDHPTDPTLIVLRCGFGTWIESEVIVNKDELLGKLEEI